MGQYGKGGLGSTYEWAGMVRVDLGPQLSGPILNIGRDQLIG